MKSKGGRVHASFRVCGDSLDPEQITAALHIFPTDSHVKGEKYVAGPRSGEIIGRTGVWLFSTKGIVASDNLYHHLVFLMGILMPGTKYTMPITKIHSILSKNRDWRADVACFWHGKAGEKRPSIPTSFTELLKLIPAEIELDFDTDSEESRLRA